VLLPSGQFTKLFLVIFRLRGASNIIKSLKVQLTHTIRHINPRIDSKIIMRNYGNFVPSSSLLLFGTKVLNVGEFLNTKLFGHLLVAHKPTLSLMLSFYLRNLQQAN